MKNIIILVSVFFISCTKDYKSGTKSYLINNTNYQIVIVPYFKNIVDSTMLQSLKPFEKKQVFESSVMGKTLSPDFGTLVQPYDSVLIIFDEKYRSKHLKFNSDSSCEKCIGFTN
ncbi:MAG: hypothetical protein IT256_04745, partial [Chitinophagaceae bacterium]|nr:hypothetical protein [Chitinophagaceae bacterium]